MKEKLKKYYYDSVLGYYIYHKKFGIISLVTKNLYKLSIKNFLQKMLI